MPSGRHTTHRCSALERRAFARRVPAGALRVDLGCGAGRYTPDLGAPCIGLDAARAMLESCRIAVPDALLVQADLEALPFRTNTLHGAWAHMSYLHVPSVRLPAALADLHRALVVGAPVELQVLAGDYEGAALPADRIGGRFFASWTSARLSDVLVGAGFDLGDIEIDGDVVRAWAVRARTLSDVVGPGMHLLVVGLNPSLYAADAGVGYARPGNRFWPAALPCRSGDTRPRSLPRAARTWRWHDGFGQAGHRQCRHLDADRVPNRHGARGATGAVAGARRGVLRGPDGVAPSRRSTRHRRPPAPAHRRSTRIRHAVHERSQRARTASMRSVRIFECARAGGRGLTLVDRAPSSDRLASPHTNTHAPRSYRSATRPAQHQVRQVPCSVR